MKNNIVVEIAKTDKDLKECLAIRRKVFIEEKNVPESIEIDEYDKPNACRHFLTTLNGKTAGTCRCVDLGDGAFKIQRFCALADYRKFGVGKATLAYVEKFAKERGAKLLRLEAKYSASGFYEKCGFKRVSDIFFEVGVEHIKMEKEIL